MAASSGHLGVKTEAVATHVTHPHWYSPPPRKAPRPLLLGDPFPSRPGRRVLPTPSCPPHSLSAVWPAPSPGPSHGGSGHRERRRAGQGREGACGPGPAACRPRGTGPPCGLIPAEPSRPHTTAPPLYSEDTRVGVTEQESSGPLPSPEGPSPHTHTHALQQGWRQVPRSGPSQGALRPLDSAGRPQPPRACAPPPWLSGARSPLSLRWAGIRRSLSLQTVLPPGSGSGDRTRPGPRAGAMGRHTGPALRGPRTVEGRLEILTFTFDRADPAEGGQRGPEHGAGQGALGLTPRPRLRRPGPAGDAEAPDVWGRP